MNHAYSSIQSIERRSKLRFLSIQKEGTAISSCFSYFIHSEENLHQSTLSGTVFSNEAKNLTLLHREIDIFQDLVAKEVFTDVFYFQYRGHIIHTHLSIPFEDWARNTSPNFKSRSFLRHEKTT